MLLDQLMIKYKEFVNMKYTVNEALNYSKRNELDKWIQSFLRDDSYKNANPNIALADGLLIEERFYIGPILINLDRITSKRIEKDLKGNELDYYEKAVERIAKDYKDYNLPPFIVEYKDNKLYLTDGNHRFSALKKLNINKYYVIIWGNKNLEKDITKYLD